MATFEQREKARAKLFEIITYNEEDENKDEIREILIGWFGWENIEELVCDAISNSELGYANLNNQFESPEQEVYNRLVGYGEEIVHEKMENRKSVYGNAWRHRLIVNGKIGDWYDGRTAAWNGNICATLDQDGIPIVIRAIPLNVEQIKSHEL